MIWGYTLARNDVIMASFPIKIEKISTCFDPLILYSIDMKVI